MVVAGFDALFYPLLANSSQRLICFMLMFPLRLGLSVKDPWQRLTKAETRSLVTCLFTVRGMQCSICNRDGRHMRNKHQSEAEEQNS